MLHEDDAHAAVNAVRAGAAFRGPWPGQAPFAVAISFDSDHETPWLIAGDTRPSRLSEAEYGVRRAMPRILSLLGSANVPATFFIPAVAASLHPADVERIVDGGHEIALHGWAHERPSTLAEGEEERLLHASLQLFEGNFGLLPRGQRTPSWDSSDRTLQLAMEAGLLYDSSLMADEEPYLLQFNGSTVSLVEIPVDWIRDDAMYFLMDREAGLRPQATPEDVSRIWHRELDVARSEGGLFQLTLHPDIIGHRSRIGVLEALISDAADAGGWFATHVDIAALAAAELLGTTSH